MAAIINNDIEGTVLVNNVAEERVISLQSYLHKNIILRTVVRKTDWIDINADNFTPLSEKLFP